MQSFYARRSQKRKNDRQVIGHFVLLRSTCIKVSCKHVGEIDPRSPPFIGNVNQQFQSNRPLTRTTTTRSPLTIRRPTETTTRRTFVATTRSTSAPPPSSFSNGLTDSGTYLPNPDKFECGTDVSG